MARVFLFCQNLLFSEGVGNLLHQDERLQIVGHESDPTNAIRQIHRLQPDVVIIDGDDPTSDLGPVMASILQESLQARIIGLNLQFNTMCLYRVERRDIRQVQDLMEAIE